MEEMLDLVNEQGDPPRPGCAAQRGAPPWAAPPYQPCVAGTPQKTACWKFCCKSAVTRKILSPGCYDISSAGHIPAGQGFVDSALRELKEELGVTAQPQDLILCGQRSFQFSAVFHGKPFKDNQVSNVYLLWLDRDAEEFTLQKEEISAVRWMPLCRLFA